MRWGCRHRMHLARREALRRFGAGDGIGVEAVDGARYAESVKGKMGPVPKITTSERRIDLEEDIVSSNYQTIGVLTL